jgi:hypothetical protein
MFVHDFSESESRKLIFENYLQFISHFQNQISKSFYQFIDGSFISNKRNPNDIDIVTFLNHSVYEAKSNQLNYFSNTALHRNMYLDNYFVKTYPVEHPLYDITTKLDTLEWLHLFSKTRVQRNGKKYSKGIIQLNFD